MIEAGKTYRLAHAVNPDYFHKKYGRPDPLVFIEMPSSEALDGPWYADQRIVTLVFIDRAVPFCPKRPAADEVWYGRMKKPDGTFLSELVMSGELVPYDGDIRDKEAE